MQALNALLESLLVIAVFLYFFGFIVSPPLRWRLWRWAVVIVAAVFGIALVVVEARAHPLAAFALAAFASLIAYLFIETRRVRGATAHRRATPMFLNLRVTGKTPVADEDTEFGAERETEEEQ
ncbi:MAG TPA: hypothetical protein VI670_26045 [Thermoanaerobaculia bacterium]|jgi:hypothetical protein